MSSLCPLGYPVGNEQLWKRSHRESSSAQILGLGSHFSFGAFKEIYIQIYTMKIYETRNEGHAFVEVLH